MTMQQYLDRFRELALEDPKLPLKYVERLVNLEWQRAKRGEEEVLDKDYYAEDERGDESITTVKSLAHVSVRLNQAPLLSFVLKVLCIIKND